MTTDGKKTPPPRITLQHIFTQVLESFNFEHGLLYTIKALALHPGTAIRNYLFSDRQRLAKPFGFLLLTTAIFVFITFQFIDQTTTSLQIPLEHPFIQQMEQTLENLSNTILEYINAVMVLTIPITSLATYWIFSKPKFYYAEHLVINGYIYGFSNLLMLALLPLISINESLSTLGFITNIYAGYVYIKVFEERLGFGILKTIAALLLSQFLTLIILLIIVILLTIF